MENIDLLKHPPKIDKEYFVPCIIKYITDDSEPPYIDEYGRKRLPETAKYIPIINKPHSDFESGQKHIHYHLDTRFIQEGEVYDTRFNGKQDITYHPLKCNSQEYRLVTNPAIIKTAKLKHRCIYKGKCPHRGMDLSQVVPKDGLIQCPLHGLLFDEKTGKLCG